MRFWVFFDCTDIDKPKMIKKLKHIRLGRKIYVTEEELNDYICSHAEIRQETEHDV